MRESEGDTGTRRASRNPPSETVRAVVIRPPPPSTRERDQRRDTRVSETGLPFCAARGTHLQDPRHLSALEDVGLVLAEGLEQGVELGDAVLGQEAEEGERKQRRFV